MALVAFLAVKLNKTKKKVIFPCNHHVLPSPSASIFLVLYLSTTVAEFFQEVRLWPSQCFSLTKAYNGISDYVDSVKMKLAHFVLLQPLERACISTRVG